MIQEKGAEVVTDKRAVLPEVKDAIGKVMEEETEDNWVTWQNNYSKSIREIVKVSEATLLGATVVSALPGSGVVTWLIQSGLPCFS